MKICTFLKLSVPTPMFLLLLQEHNVITLNSITHINAIDMIRFILFLTFFQFITASIPHFSHNIVIRGLFLSSTVTTLPCFFITTAFLSGQRTQITLPHLHFIGCVFSVFTSVILSVNLFSLCGIRIHALRV